MEEWEKLQNLGTIGEEDPLNRFPPNPTVKCSFSCAGRNFRGLPRNFRTPRSHPNALGSSLDIVRNFGLELLAEISGGPEFPD